MSRTPTLTILLLDARRSVRADFNGAAGGEPLRLDEMPRETAVADLLRAGSRPAARVLVLNEALWSQTVSLPRLQVERLSPRETSDALAYEVEPFSNLPPTLSATGFRRAGEAKGQLQFWVVQSPRDEIAGLRDTVRRAGGRLLGLSHPAGLGSSDAAGDLRATLAAWARAVARGPEQLPLITPPPVAPPVSRQTLAGLVLTSAMLALCAVHGLWTRADRNGLRKEAEALRAAAAEVGGLEGRNTALRREVEALRKAEQERVEAAVQFAQRRQALPRLLAAFAGETPTNLVIQQMQSEGAWRLRVAGLGLTPAAVDGLAASLRVRLVDSGWQLEAPEKSAQGLFDNGGPWRFAVRIALTNAPAAVPAPVVRMEGD